MPSKKEIQERCIEYRKLIKDASAYLASYQAVINYCPDMQACCQSLKSMLTNRIKPNQSWTIPINPAWKIPTTNQKLCGVKGEVYLTIAGHITADNGILNNQSISALLILVPTANQQASTNYNCGNLVKGESIVIRRFHFDYDPTISQNDRPRSHLQYGGECEDHILSLKDLRYELFSTLTLPRIPHPPFDVIQVLNLFIHQFPTRISQLTEESAWRSYVRRSDNLWLKGYHEELSSHLGGAQPSTSLYDRQCLHVDWL